MRLFIAFIAIGFSLVPCPNSCWSSERLPAAQVGEPYEYVVTIKGLSAPLSFDWTKGDRPSWVQFAGPIISGTPSESQEKPYTLRLLVTDAFGKSTSVEYELSVLAKSGPLSISTEFIPVFHRGQDSRYEVTAVGGEGDYRWTECAPISLPEGLVVESGDNNQYCLIKGCAKENGKIHIRVTVSDENGNTQSKDLYGQVVGLASSPKSVPSPKIESFIPPASLNVPYSAQLIAVGGTPPYTWDLKVEEGSDLSWIVLDKKSGILTGTPDKITEETFSVQLKDGSGQTAARDMRLVVNPMPLKLITESLPSATQGVPYSAQLTALGGALPYTWNLKAEKDGDLSWIFLDQKTGVLSGTPDKITKEKFAVELKDGSGQTAARDMWLVVNPLPLKLVTEFLPSATQGVPYSGQIIAIGGIPPYSWNIDATKAGYPIWLSIDPKTGILAGTPDSSGVFNITVQAKDTERKIVASELKLTVQALKAPAEVPAKREDKKQKTPQVAEPKPQMKKPAEAPKITSHKAPGDTGKISNGPPKESDRFKAVITILGSKTEDGDLSRGTESEKRRERDNKNREQRIAALLAQGKTAMSRQEFDKARDAFYNVLKIDPANEVARIRLDGIRDEEDLLRKEKEISHLLALGDVSLKVPDYKQARQIYADVLKRDPTNTEALKKLEIIKRNQEQQEKEKTKKEEFHMLLAAAKQKLQSCEFAAALELSKKALQLCPNSKEIIHDGRFIGYADGTVLDTKTKLMWAATDSGNLLNERNLANYIANYRGGGYRDWRLPTLEELEMIYDRDVENEHGYHVNKLIDITGECIWASEGWGNVQIFDFNLGSLAVLGADGRGWVIDDFCIARALPVRDCD
jgi:tetratricopeptide (TPR) repeat protein